MEAYNNQVYCGRGKTGTFVVRGLTSENVLIEMVINLLGEMTSAYPVIEKL